MARERRRYLALHLQNHPHIHSFQLNAVAHDWHNLSLWSSPITLNKAMQTVAIKAMLFLTSNNCPYVSHRAGSAAFQQKLTINGASLSEPHTSKSERCNFHIYIYIYISVIRHSVNASWHSFNPKHCARHVQVQSEKGHANFLWHHWHFQRRCCEQC